MHRDPGTKNGSFDDSWLIAQKKLDLKIGNTDLNLNLNIIIIQITDDILLIFFRHCYHERTQDFGSGAGGGGAVGGGPNLPET